MDNDVFVLGLNYAPVVEVFADSGQDSVSAVSGDDSFTQTPATDEAQQVLDQEIDDAHPYAMHDGVIDVNGLGILSDGSYDSTLASFAMYDGGIEGYASMVQMVQGMNYDGHGFG